MKAFQPISVISALLLASGAMAQRYTTTLPWANGDTIVVTVSTDPVLGIATTSTISTIVSGVTATSSTTTRTRTTATTATATSTDENGNPITTTGQRVVGQQETMDPMRTTTYWYDPGSGVWTSAVWTASVTAAPDVATAIVPEGSIADYGQYQSSINKNVFASAEAANASAAAGSAGKIGASAWAWAGMVGAIGAGVLAVAL